MKRVVIIGGGISGLSVAWQLYKAGINVTVLEKRSAVGGTMQTIHDDGWLVETGPNSALETTPLFRQMCDDLGIESERLYANDRAKKRYILRDGRLQSLPTSPLAFLRSSLWSFNGKLRLLKEPFVGRASVEESIADFVERRLGREFLDYAINPFVAGVYAGDPKQLSIRSAFPKLYALEEKYGGLIKGMIKGRRERKKRAEKAKDRAEMFSFVKGMQMFPEAIARHLGDSVLTGIEVKRISPNKDTTFHLHVISGEKEELMTADAVVMTVPAMIAAKLVAPLSESVARGLESIYYPPVTEVFLGFRETQIGMPLDGFGFLVPEVERRNILGTIWSSSLFPGRAPSGFAALTTFVGGARQPGLCGLDDRQVVSTVLEELRSIMRIEGEPVYRKITRWDRAIPQYNLGHHHIIENIERFEAATPGLFLGGNYRGGISVGDCVMSGERIAQRVLSHVAIKSHSVGMLSTA
ncbi:MAG: protoporphyrinogen oxidase [Bacteroidota bacterium]